MSLDSVSFLLAFIPFVFIYHALSSAKSKRIWLLIGSAFFLAYNALSFLLVAALYALVNFSIARAMASAPSDAKKVLLYRTGLTFNIIGLCLFKYVDFLLAEFNVLPLDSGASTPVLGLLLPIGISYYTFQSIAYLFDVFHENDEPEDSLLDFSIFILFFPKLIAGPIERAYDFLPQLKSDSSFELVSDQFKEGLRRFVWGLFKKVVVSTALWTLISPAFVDIGAFNGISLLLVAVLYPFQIYAEFSGYTDMAIGGARMLGFKLSENFKNPFGATSISEFWRRWHITLSSWVNEYIYTPLSMKIALTKNWGKFGVLLAISLSFLVLGIWHGARWTYLLFGAFQALYIGFEILSKKRRTAWSKKFHKGAYTWISIAITFMFYAFSTIFFGLETVTEGIHFVSRMCTGFMDSLQIALANIDLARQHVLYLDNDLALFTKAIGLLIVFLLLQAWIDKHGFESTGTKIPRPVRWVLYYLLLGAIFFNSQSEVSFLYGTF